MEFSSFSALAATVIICLYSQGTKIDMNMAVFNLETVKAIGGIGQEVLHQDQRKSHFSHNTVKSQAFSLGRSQKLKLRPLLLYLLNKSRCHALF